MHNSSEQQGESVGTTEVSSKEEEHEQSKQLGLQALEARCE
jgi:hypothetical protein